MKFSLEQMNRLRHAFNRGPKEATVSRLLIGATTAAYLVIFGLVQLFVS